MTHIYSRVLPAACVLGLALATGPARQAHAQSLSLREAVSRALTEGYDSQLAQLEAERSHADYEQARSFFLPKIAVTSYAGYSNRINDKLEVLDHDGVPRTYGLATLGARDGWLNFTLDQVLLDVSRWREAASGRMAARAARVQEEQGRENVAFEVTRRFANLVRIQQLEQLSSAAEEDAEWIDDQARLLLEAGRVLATERQAVALHLADARIDARSRRLEAREATASLWIAIAPTQVAPDAIQVDTSGLPAPSAAGALEVDYASLEQSPELRALDLEHRIQEKKVGAARGGWYPKLKLYGGYSHYGINRFDNFEDEFLVGIDFKLPLFDGFETKSAIGSASKSAEIARLRHRSALVAKRGRIRDLERQLRSVSEELELTGLQQETAHERRRLADLNLRAGRGTLNQALGARERYVRVLEEAAATRFRQIELWAEIQRDLGLLTQVILEP